MNLDKEIQGRFIAIKKQLADVMTNMGILEGLLYVSSKKEEEPNLKVEGD